jgi:hypothetical protein
MLQDKPPFDRFVVLLFSLLSYTFFMEHLDLTWLQKACQLMAFARLHASEGRISE